MGNSSSNTSMSSGDAARTTSTRPTPLPIPQVQSQAASNTISGRDSITDPPINNANIPSSSAPGAFKMAGQPRNQRFYVTIPRGVKPGQHFAVLVNGKHHYTI